MSTPEDPTRTVTVDEFSTATMCQYAKCPEVAGFSLPMGLGETRILCADHTESECRAARPLSVTADTIERLARDGEFTRWADDWASERAPAVLPEARRDSDLGVQYLQAAVVERMMNRLDEDLLYAGTDWVDFERRCRRDAAERFANRVASG